MADQNSDNLDLAQILQTLASLPPTANAPIDYQYQAHDQSQAPEQIQSKPTPYDSARTGLPYVHEQSLDPRLSGRATSLHRPHSNTQNRTVTPTIDPATITEWKQGLRCVNKIAAQNPNFVGTVQKLMKDQERNVKDWGAGRQRLINDQKVKRENEKTHRAALSLPGLLGNTPLLRTPECEQAELSQYDQKVYRACRSMVESQSTQLKTLGVPFFGVKPELILLDGVNPIEEDPEIKQEMSKKITKKQVLELQRKMLNHLMEMYGD